MTTKLARAMDEVEDARQKLNSCPRWRWLKSQELGRNYRWALARAAWLEMRETGNYKYLPPL